MSPEEAALPRGGHASQPVSTSGRRNRLAADPPTRISQGVAGRPIRFHCVSPYRTDPDSHRSALLSLFR